MSEIEVLREELKTLQKQVNDLEKAKINAETIPAEELLYLHDRVGEMHQYLQDLAEKEAPVIPVRVSLPRVDSSPIQPSKTPPEPPKSKSRFTEVNVGKYAAAVLAAVLVLMAAMSFASMVWEDIPHAIKFLLISGLGIAGVVGGSHMVKKQPKNGFWLAVTALGFGVLYVSLAAGCLAWGLFPPPVALVLYVMWFAGCFLYAKKISSIVFYAISYIGGGLCVLFSKSIISPRCLVSEQIVFSLLCFVLVSFGIYSDGSFFSSDDKSEEQKRVDRAVSRMNIGLGYVVLGCLMGFAVSVPTAFLLRVMVLFVAVFLMYSIIRNISLASLSMFLCIPAWVCYAVDAHMFFGMDVEISLQAACICMLGICVIFLLLHGTVPVFCALSSFIVFTLAELGTAVFGITSMLPFLLAAGEYLGSHFFLAKEDEDKRLFDRTVFFVYLCAWACHGIEVNMLHLGMAQLALTCLCSLAYPAVHYFLVKPVLEGRGVQCSRIIDLCFYILSLGFFLNDFGSSPAILAFLTVPLLLAHKVFVLEKTEIPEGLFWLQGDLDRANWIYLFLLMLMDGALWASIGMDANIPIAAATIVMIAGCFIYETILSSGNLKTAFMMGLSHVQVFPFVLALGLAEVAILSSIMGLFLCAAFLALGFSLRKKQLRILGLVSMMIYVLKITLVDIPLMVNTPGLTIFMLLVGGGVCFGISYAYNKLAVKYEGKEEVFRENDSQ